MPSSSSGSLLLPGLIWNSTAPDCQIASLMVSETERFIFTGTTSGHIIMWDFSVDEINPLDLIIGHTSVVNCLAKAGSSKDEEYIVSSSENGEMKLWEINEKKCIENIKLTNTIHKNIYSSKVNGKYTRLFCIGNYTDVLVIDPMSLDILYTLVSREQPQWIKALCINSLANKQDDVIVGVSITGTIKLWTVNANEAKGSEIIEHEFRNCQCENANTLASCPGKQRIFIVVCPKFFQIFDAFDFTVLCQMNISSIVGSQAAASSPAHSSIELTNGFFIDIESIVVCTSDGFSYLFALPDNYHESLSSSDPPPPVETFFSVIFGTVNPQSTAFRQKLGSTDASKFYAPRLVHKFVSTLSGANNESGDNRVDNKTYGPPVFHLYKKNTVVTNATGTATNSIAKYLIRGDARGCISLWSLNNTSQNLLDGGGGVQKKCNYEVSLAKFWTENCKQDSENFGSISTFLYLPTIDKLVYGMNDGSIIILPAVDFLIKNLFQRNLKDKSNMTKLKKHTAKVTCLLYPHSEHPRYDSSMLVTGSIDFSIVLWNINTGDVIHRFVVQSGEILQLSVPPNNVNPRILQCICAIANDHSVALLSLKECKPVMIASRHLFPVSFVKWRPLDDYLIVKCTDGGVFVWQIETGNLDRVAHGLLADDILSAADEIVSNVETFAASTASSLVIPSATAAVAAGPLGQPVNNVASFSTPTIVSNKAVSNQAITLAHILQKRNFGNAIKNISQKLASAHKDNSNRFQSTIDSSMVTFPLIIQPFHLSLNDPVKHLLLFDIDALLTTLILEEYAIESMIKFIKNHIYKEVQNSQAAPLQTMNLQYRTAPDINAAAMRRNVSSRAFDSIDVKHLNLLKTKLAYAQSNIKLIQILLSSLHAWQLDPSLDKLFTDKLEFQRPKFPITFGRISRGAHLFVSFPQRQPPMNAIVTLPPTISSTNPFFNEIKEVKFFAASTTTLTTTAALGSNSGRIAKEKSMNLINFDDEMDTTPVNNENVQLPPTASVSVVSAIRRMSFELTTVGDLPSPTRDQWIANKSVSTEHLLTILSISNLFMNLQNFIDLHSRKEDLDPIEFVLGNNSLHALSHNTDDRAPSYAEKQTELKQTYSRLSTMYCMLPDYYNGTSGSFKALNLETLSLKWMDPSYDIREAAQALLKSELKRIGPNGRVNLIKIWEPQLSSLLKDFDDLNQQPQQLQLQPQQLTSMASSTQSLASNASTISIDTQAALQANSGMTQSQQTIHNDLSAFPPNSHRIRRKQFVAIIILSLIGAEFGQDVNSNKTQAPYKTIPQGFSLEDHSILKRISTALSNLVTNKSLMYDVTRRAAIDLIGRGFSIWEPFIQPTFILLSLLELAADAELYVPRSSINLPLIPIADSCRIARNSLTLIANSKPKTFILTIAKEIKRINTTSSQNSQNTNVTFPFGQALTRGKPEILTIIERLIENQSQDVYELLSDVIEIILFCLDPNQIRSNGLEECFTAIFKFPMVRYCKESKRIICGCNNGRLVMYEYKNSKWNYQSYTAHSGQPIVAVSISNDSKYIASYSAHENTLIFWQSSGGNIFNIGSSSLKQSKVCNAAPIEISVPINKLASLYWQNKTLNLIYHDNRKFSYQI